MNKLTVKKGNMDYQKYLEVFGERIRPEVRALVERGDVTLDEWKNFRGNSYEHEVVMRRLTDEAFCYAAEYIRANCSYDRSRIPFVSYNEAAMVFVIPELIRRLKAVRAPVHIDEMTVTGPGAVGVALK